MTAQKVDLGLGSWADPRGLPDKEDFIREVRKKNQKRAQKARDELRMHLSSAAAGNQK